MAWTLADCCRFGDSKLLTSFATQPDAPIKHDCSRHGAGVIVIPSEECPAIVHNTARAFGPRGDRKSPLFRRINVPTSHKSVRAFGPRGQPYVSLGQSSRKQILAGTDTTCTDSTFINRPTPPTANVALGHPSPTTQSPQRGSRKCLVQRRCQIHHARGEIRQHSLSVWTNHTF